MRTLQESISQKVFTRNVSKRDRAKAQKPYKVKWLYEYFGISKQAYYKRIQSDKAKQDRNQVKVGKNSIVGMGSVVTKDVQDNCVVVGAPAKIVRRLDPN